MAEARGVTGEVHTWPDSTYIAEPPFFDDFALTPPSAGDISAHGACIMALFGDS